MASERTIELFGSPAEFRAWLAANHAISPGIWLKIAKKDSGAISTTYDEALEVALTFGWIDGQKQSCDATFWLQGFTPRRLRSPWSKRNCGIAQTLIDSSRMEPSGLAEVERAKADGRWAEAYESQRDAQEPQDLLDSLAANPAALQFYSTLNSANRYAILYRIQDAKRPETRAARIAKFTEMLARGESLYP